MSASLVEVLASEGIAATAVFATTAEDLLSTLAERPLGIVLLDLDLGVLGDGRLLVAPITRMGADVLILTASHDELSHAACLEAGAVGIISKDATLESLLSSLRTAAAGRPVCSAAERERLVADLRRSRRERSRRLAPFESLTPRETEVLDAMIHGMAAGVIAEELCVSVTTVRSHVRSVLLKLGASSQLEAVSLAREVDWKTR